MTTRWIPVAAVIAVSAVIEIILQKVMSMLKLQGNDVGLIWLAWKFFTIAVLAVGAQLVVHRRCSFAISKVVLMLVAGVAIGGLLKLAHYLFIVRYGILQIMDIWASVGAFFFQLGFSIAIIAALSWLMRTMERKMAV